MIRLVFINANTVDEAMTRKLRNAGYKVDWCSNTEEGTRRALAGQYAAIVLDLPALTAQSEVIRRLREKHNQTPVLMIRDSADVAESVRGVGVEGDESLVRPYMFKDLKARLSELLQRDLAKRERIFQIADLRIDVKSRLVHRSGIPLSLTAREFDLLLALAEHPGKVVSKETILATWGSWESTFNTVEVHLSALRRKLKTACPENVPLIRTVYGYGYVLCGASRAI